MLVKTPQDFNQEVCMFTDMLGNNFQISLMQHYVTTLNGVSVIPTLHPERLFSLKRSDSTG